MISLVRSQARAIFFPSIDDSHDVIHSSLITSFIYFYNGYVGKVASGSKTNSRNVWTSALGVVIKLKCSKPHENIQSVYQPHQKVNHFPY